jgi:hypothetical protein
MAGCDEIRWVGAVTGAVRTAIWSLPLAAGCPSDTVEDEDGAGEDSTTAADASMSAEDGGDDATIDGGDGGTTTDDGGDDTTTTVSDGGDTLVDGCWDRDFTGEPYSGDYDPPWDRFECALPIPCQRLDVHFDSSGEVTPEDIADADASARCMLEALRDGTPADHSITVNRIDGQYVYEAHYYVLPDGVVGSLESFEDLGGGTRERYRQTREDAFFDECLTQRELEPLVACLVGTNQLDGGFFPALDLDACIDGEPMCPE